MTALRPMHHIAMNDTIGTFVLGIQA